MNDGLLNRPATDWPKLLLDARQAAEALSICEKTLWSITQPRGDLPCVRIGRRILYDPADLRAWICTRKGNGTP